MASAILRRSAAMMMNGCLRRRSDRLVLLNSSAIAKRGMADETGMPLTFASPYTALYDAVHVRQVDVPSFSGSFGILPNHVPALAVLKPGVVTVFEADGSAKKFFVSSGTVTINEDSSVQILAEEAVPLENLDKQAAERNLSAAQSALSSASTEQAKAEAQILVEVNEAIIKAD